jgi:hypothetical protein
MKLTATLNELGMNVAYVSEEAKDRNLRGYKQPEPIDQISIAGAQFDRELIALRNYSLIVTDSPLHLASIYCRYYEEKPTLKTVVLTMMATILDDNYPSLNILLGKPSGGRSHPIPDHRISRKKPNFLPGRCMHPINY